MAAVFCASFRRRAMVWRSRVMCTRSSRAASSAGDGARICTGAATGVGCAAARSIAAIMSPLVTWPCMPEPSTLDGSTPLSAAILRTDGGMRHGTTSRQSRQRVWALRAAWRRAARLWRARQPPAPSVIWPSSAATPTVSPVLAAMSDKTPAAGAGTSSVTLSVSSSTSGSSTATASPGCLNHLPTVASVTDSPRVGTRMSAMVVTPYSSIVILRCERSEPRRMTARTVAVHPSRATFGRHLRMTEQIYPNASSSNCLSCARCFGICPTAVEADAGRPA